MRFPALIFALFVAGAANAQEMRSITDASGAMIEILVKPERIIGMHDQLITLTLIERGAPVSALGQV
ncbi:hypothetical protein [Yoonia sp. SDW83-1]|uniref:hypothetical protein n=1 Tax=Yoonia sp. SDW83-1 TaxID=3366945 RepID=UPI00398C5F6E